MAATLTTELYAAATERWMAREFVQQWNVKQPYLTYMQSNGKVVKGGHHLRVPISTTVPTNTGAIADLLAALAYAGPTGQYADYTWAQYGGRAAIDDGEKMKIAGEVGQLNLLQQRLRDVVDYVKLSLSIDLFAKAQATNGAISFYDAVTNASTLGGVTVSAPWAGTHITATHATDPVGAATIETDITTGSLALMGADAVPDLVLCSASVWTKLSAERAGKALYYPSQNKSISGYHAIVNDQGTTIMYEPKMFEESGGTTGKIKGWILVMDTERNPLVKATDSPSTVPFRETNAFVEGYNALWFAQQVLGKPNAIWLKDYKIT